MLLAADHARCLRKANALSRLQMSETIGPLEVIRVLNRAKISFVLVGAYGLVGWFKKPRATEDVDVVVAAKQTKRAVKLLAEAFPDLEPFDCEVVVRFRRRGTDEVAIDVMKPLQPPYRDIFKHTVSISKGGLTYRVPCLEMALTCKFAPLVSLMRADKDKYLDAHDFVAMVEANPDIDWERLKKLGDLVYPGGGDELTRQVQAAQAGKRLTF